MYPTQVSDMAKSGVRGRKANHTLGEGVELDEWVAGGGGRNTMILERSVRGSYYSKTFQALRRTGKKGVKAWEIRQKRKGK